MNEYRWLIYALAGAVCAAAVGVLGKAGLVRHIDSTLATAIRSVVMTLFLLAVVTAMGLWNRLPQVGGRPWLLIALSGVAGALSWLFMFKALQLSDVSRTMPIDKLSLPLGIVLAFLLLGERPAAGNWVGVGLMTVGALLAGWNFSR